MTVLTDLLGRNTIMEFSGAFQSASVNFQKLGDALKSFVAQIDKATP